MRPDIPGVSLGALLGEGGTGRVYEALKGEEQVAVKVVDAEIARARGFTRRFLNAAHALRKLSHPGLPVVCDVGLLLDGTPYVVMERIDGRDLGTVLSLEGALTYRKAARVGALVAEALACAHTGGLLHLDMKPGNILLLGDGQVKLIDFLGVPEPGAARLGVPEYWSPELAGAAEVDARSDIYSLGVVLFEALAGAPPFRSHSHGQLVSQHLRQAPARLRAPTGRPAIPDALRTVIETCLAKEPAQRYQRAGDLAAELRKLSGAYTPAPTAQADAPARAAQSDAPGAGADAPAAGADAPAAGAETPSTMAQTRAPRTAAGLARRRRARPRRRRAIFLVAAALSIAVAAVALAIGFSGGAPGPTVRMSLSSEPTGAEVVLDGQRQLGRTATTVQLPRSDRPVSLEFRAAGRPPMRVQVVPDRAAQVHAQWGQERR